MYIFVIVVIDEFRVVAVQRSRVLEIIFFRFFLADPSQGQQQIERLRGRSSGSVRSRSGGAASLRRTHTAAGRVLPAAAADFAARRTRQTRSGRQEDRRSEPSPAR